EGAGQAERKQETALTGLLSTSPLAPSQDQRNTPARTIGTAFREGMQLGWTGFRYSEPRRGPRSLARGPAAGAGAGIATGRISVGRLDVASVVVFAGAAFNARPPGAWAAWANAPSAGPPAGTSAPPDSRKKRRR